MRPRAPAAEHVFRPRRVLAAVMAGAVLLWVTVLLYLLQFEEVPTRTFLSAGFFVVFFLVSLTYYARSAVYVDAGGVTFRGMLRTRRFSFQDIRKVDVLPGPVIVYAVRVNQRFVHFTSFFQQHRRLMELLVERAGLAPV